MQIRLRSADKTVTTIPNIPFVELCNEDGQVMAILAKNKANDVLDIYDVRDKEVIERYSKVFNVEFVKDIRAIDPTKYSSS